MIYAIRISSESTDCLQFGTYFQSSHVVKCSSLKLFLEKTVFVVITVSGWHNEVYRELIVESSENKVITVLL